MVLRLKMCGDEPPAVDKKWLKDLPKDFLILNGNRTERFCAYRSDGE